MKKISRKHIKNERERQELINRFCKISMNTKNDELFLAIIKMLFSKYRPKSESELIKERIEKLRYYYNGKKKYSKKEAAAFRNAIDLCIEQIEDYEKHKEYIINRMNKRELTKC